MNPMLYILTLTGRPEKVFSVNGVDDVQVVPMFVEEEDAERYVFLVDEVNDPAIPDLDVVEVDGAAIMAACASQNTEFIVFQKDDLIIPPRVL